MYACGHTFIHTAKCVRACVYIMCVSTCVYMCRGMAFEVKLAKIWLCKCLSLSAHSSPPPLPLAWGWEQTASHPVPIPSDLRKHTLCFLSYLSTHGFLMPESLLDIWIILFFSASPENPLFDNFFHVFQYYQSDFLKT